MAVIQDEVCIRTFTKKCGFQSLQIKDLIVVNVYKFKPSIKSKEKDMRNKKSYSDIVIGDKIWGTVMLVMGRYDISTNVAVTNNVK